MQIPPKTPLVSPGIGERNAGLRDLLDKHPLFAAIGIAVGVAATVSGVMQYFHTQTVARLNDEKAAAIRSATTPLLKEVQTLSETRDELARALASFRRTAGPTSTVFDIRNLLIDHAAVRGLPSTFKYYDSYRVYIATPPSKDWKFEETSEGALAVRLMPDSDRLLHTIFGEKSPIFRKNLLLWRDPRPLTVTVDREIDQATAAMLGMKTTSEVHLFPFVAIQKVDRNLMKDMLKSFAFEDTAQTNKTSSHPSPEQRPNSLLALEEIFSADIAGSMLIAQSNAMLALAQGNKNVTFKIANAEKKGPVLYLNVVIQFKNAHVKGVQGLADVKWDRELMVTSFGDTAYLIVTSVPTISDERSSAFAWVTQWLQNVRIPCECTAGTSEAASRPAA